LTDEIIDFLRQLDKHESGPTRTDKDATARVNWHDRLRSAAEQAGWTYAEECMRIVFEVLRDTYPTAAWLLLNRGADDDGDTAMTLMAVRDHDGALVWWNTWYNSHPDAEASGRERPERELDDDEVVDLEGHLRDAYDQPGPSMFDPAGESDYRGLSTWSSWTLLEVGDPGPARVPVRETLQRTVHVLQMSEEQFYGVSARLDLPKSWFGRFKGAPGEVRDPTFSDTSDECGDKFDLLLDYVRELGLAHAVSVTTTVGYRAVSR